MGAEKDCRRYNASPTHKSGSWRNLRTLEWSSEEYISLYLGLTSFTRLPIFLIRKILLGKDVTSMEDRFMVLGNIPRGLLYMV
jgi:hypothetical protein